MGDSQKTTTVGTKRENDDQTLLNNNKKQKKETDTIPILRGRFKQRWLTKHSHLLKRSDDACGILVSCNVNAETRALGQVSTCLEQYIVKLFPEHETTWVRFEGKLDIDEIDFENDDDDEKLASNNNDDKDGDEEKMKKKENEEKQKKLIIESRKEKKFQAVDAACGGLVFYRFRINVKPTDFVLKLMDYLKQLPDEERKAELAKLRHCARWIPLDYICPATTERIISCFERVKKDYFQNNEIDTTETVAIITEIRNNILITKEEIINAIAPMIPPQYKVDLKKPTYVILVTVFKSACGITVLKDYYERKKYNLLLYCQ
ncbi:hypothetical protein BDF20DRAFT_913619 [Mycotypha africana]|uniref:uncharacterized protein n=1 Tax=Mycotypha africana TaxID=64632 RepID=UPI002301529F|nr:uncharacterized protein BDF20DRAFT_913619 [Mycotypha africana]KAI8977272.1 hypothetical protein BDF20DRAFT_913619 [Mycotypha africana]